SISYVRLPPQIRQQAAESQCVERRWSRYPHGQVVESSGAECQASQRSGENHRTNGPWQSGSRQQQSKPGPDEVELFLNCERPEMWKGGIENALIGEIPVRQVREIPEKLSSDGSSVDEESQQQ